MYRIAAGLTSVGVGALAGFPGTTGTIVAVVGSGLVLSGVDRTIPARALQVRTAGPTDPERHERTAA